ELEIPLKMQQLTASLLRDCNDAIVIADEQGHIAVWNPAAERVFGWTAEEAFQRPLVEMLPIDRVAAGAREALACPGAWRGELDLVDRDGRPLTLDVELSHVVSSDGASDVEGGVESASCSDPTPCCLVICRDMTALKRAAQALRDSEIRLRESEERFR